MNVTINIFKNKPVTVVTDYVNRIKRYTAIFQILWEGTSQSSDPDTLISCVGWQMFCMEPVT